MHKSLWVKEPYSPPIWIFGIHAAFASHYDVRCRQCVPIFSQAFYGVRNAQIELEPMEIVLFHRLIDIGLLQACIFDLKRPQLLPPIVRVRTVIWIWTKSHTP